MHSVRVIVASALALGLVLVVVALAWAAPVLSIDPGQPEQTNDRTPQFTFTVDETATSVECSIVPDQAPPEYGECSGATTHQPDSDLGDGNYVFWVQASDGVDPPVSATHSFTVDGTPPSLLIDSSAGDPTNDRTPSLGFAVGGDATSVECWVDQDAPVSCASPWMVAAPLSDGSHTFHVRASDALGNEATDAQDFTVDATPPSLLIGAGQAGPTNDRTPQFAFAVSGATSVECWVDQDAPVSCASPYTAGTPLADGSHTFHVQASDALSNRSSDSLDFTVDATPPLLSIDSGPDGPTNDRTPSFAFTAGGDATSVECWIDQATPVSCTSSYTVGTALADGRHTFHVRAADGLGNQLTRTRDFSVDSSAPPLTIDSGPPSETNDATPSFVFTTDAPRVECAVDQGTYGPCTSPTTYVVGSPLSEGLHTFRVQATSRLGNHAIESRSFTVDTTPPSVAITFGPAGVTGDSTPLFQFAADAEATVACSIDQGAPAYGPCTGAGAHAAIAPLADGAYTFRVRATDRAGNETTAERTFTVDTVADPPGPGSPRPGPTPSARRLLSPFPVVRIAGTLTATGVRIRLLSVRAPRGALVRITVSPSCRRPRHASRRCHVVQAAGTVGRGDRIGFRALARAYRSGTVIVVRVWSADRIGKYTRFTIVRGKAPRRVDRCLVPGATSGSRCPSA